MAYDKFILKANTSTNKSYLLTNCTVYLACYGTEESQATTRKYKGLFTYVLLVIKVHTLLCLYSELGNV